MTLLKLRYQIWHNLAFLVALRLVALLAVVEAAVVEHQPPLRSLRLVSTKITFLVTIFPLVTGYLDFFWNFEKFRELPWIRLGYSGLGWVL